MISEINLKYFKTIMYPFLWIFVVGTISTVFTSFGIGANDVANSFATSVGAKVLTLRQAVLIAGIFELAGAVLMGSHVTDTVRKGIVSSELFEDSPYLLMFGMLCASISTGFWLLMATYFKAPVSTTHSSVGSIIGFALVYGGLEAIKWDKVVLIILSWIISPVMSGVLTLIIFSVIKYGALRQNDPITRSLQIYPLMVWLTIAINTFFVIYKGSPALGLNKTPIWLGLLVSFAIGLLFAIASVLLNKYYLEDKVKKWTQKQKDIENQQDQTEENQLDKHQLEKDQQSEEKTSSKIKVGKFEREEYDSSAEKLFSFLQIFTACLSSFAHGANDVANSIGPYAAIVSIYFSSSVSAKSEVPIWILFVGGLGIVFGLAIWGRRVIERMGNDLVSITASRGFSMELGASLSVVTASRLGIPVSTTHCQVGSIVGGGLADGTTSNVSWTTMGWVALGWLITLPVTAGVSAGLYAFAFYSPN